MENCRHCGSSNLYTTKNSVHVGLYCGSCGKFLSWVKQEHNIETGEVASEPQQQYALSLLHRWKQQNIPMTKRQAGAIIQAFKG